jgi:chloramphenicol O-acetyltransferase type A
MKYLDIDRWNRKQHFKHFIGLSDPFFGVVVSVDVTSAYQFSKEREIPFFVTYLFACMKALNSIENFRYRIHGTKVAVYDTIHASATILREDGTFGFSYIHYVDDFEAFYQNFLKEKERILNTIDLFPPINSDDCIYCSALPWLHFSGHKEPVSSVENDAVPRVAFGKFLEKDGKLMMPVSITVHHGLIDGYHVGEFFKQYQIELNKIN